MRYLQFAIYMYASAAKRYNAVILDFFSARDTGESLSLRRGFVIKKRNFMAYLVFISVCVNYLTISLLNPTFFNSSLLESRHAH